MRDANKTKVTLAQELESLRRDVAELVHDQEALQRDLEMAHEFLDLTGVLIGVIDTEQRITFVNKMATDISGYGKEEVIGRNAFDILLPEEARDDIKETIMGVLNGDTESPIYADIPILAKGGETRAIAWHIVAVRNRDGVIIGALGSGSDVTERKMSQRRLEESRELLRNLTEHLQSTREEEKKRISREIHDDLGHALAILRMDLAWLKKRLPDNQEALLNKVDSISNSIAVAIQKVKAISAGLRPGLLDDIGLTAAIEWQAEEVQKLTGIKCNVTSNPTEMILDRDRSTVIFRSFQQLLSNVIYHSKATRVEITITQTSDNITLEVKDNGIGITKEQVSNPKSFGLIGIQERLRFLSGELEIAAINGKGTIAKVIIPLTKRRYYQP